MTKSRSGILMKWVIALCLGALGGPSLAQLSPGDLSEVHAHLEGIANCTQCHTLGEKITNGKCLDCHDEIAGLIDEGRGYHANRNVRGQDCFACHSEHHGRKFDMVRFNTETFDHNMTGFQLDGRHATVDCRSCHIPDNIADAEIRKREGTFLGLQEECASCHNDFHQGTLGNDCASCHTTDGFRPAPGFDHDGTSFALTGAHTSVECTECHRVTTRSGSEFQMFAGTEFTSCASCHEDAHEGRFGTNCADCHNTTSFHSIGGQADFNHDGTGFPLRGSHSSLDCASCHDASSGSGKRFSEFAHLDVINCTNCHDDVHNGRFGNDCASCHNVVSFRDVEGIDAFDHSLTDFPLEGKHTAVDCRSCHQENMTADLPHNACVDCHDDFHNDQFDDPECSRCHTVEGFAGSTFDIGRHSETNFALEGAHLATPCFECHLRDETWHFADLEIRCVACHENIHKDVLTDNYYPDETCTACHNTDSWASINFNHTGTGFELIGRHDEIACGACHREDAADAERIVFEDIGLVCADCHRDSHGGQFADSQGVVRCAECHTPIGWAELLFEHDSTRMALEGAHADVACVSCHHIDDRNVTVYRGTPFECAACHK